MAALEELGEIVNAEPNLKEATISWKLKTNLLNLSHFDLKIPDFSIISNDELEEGQIIDENQNSLSDQVCLLFKSNLCFRPKCPFIHLNEDGSYAKDMSDSFDLTKSQAEIIAKLFDLDTKLIEEKIVDNWQLCVKRELRKQQTSNYSKSNFQNFDSNIDPLLNEQDSFDIEQYYGIIDPYNATDNDDDNQRRTKRTQYLLDNDEYLKKLILLFSSNIKSLSLANDSKKQHSEISRDSNGHKNQQNPRYFDNYFKFSNLPSQSIGNFNTKHSSINWTNDRYNNARIHRSSNVSRNKTSVYDKRNKNVYNDNFQDQYKKSFASEIISKWPNNDNNNNIDTSNFNPRQSTSSRYRSSRYYPYDHDKSHNFDNEYTHDNWSKTRQKNLHENLQPHQHNNNNNNYDNNRNIYENPSGTFMNRYQSRNRRMTHHHNNNNHFNDNYHGSRLYGNNNPNSNEKKSTDDYDDKSQINVDNIKMIDDENQVFDIKDQLMSKRSKYLLPARSRNSRKINESPNSEKKQAILSRREMLMNHLKAAEEAIACERESME